MAECFVDGGGGGVKVTTGKIIPATTINISPADPYTVSGLPFQPTHVVVVMHPYPSGGIEGLNSNILAISTDATKGIRGSRNNIVNASPTVGIVFLSDGFVIQEYYSMYAEYTYQWIAWTE